MRPTGEEIRVRGLAALRKELGRAGLARFLRHYEAGRGDYTRDRRKLLQNLTMAELRTRVARPKRRRGQGAPGVRVTSTRSNTGVRR